LPLTIRVLVFTSAPPYAPDPLTADSHQTFSRGTAIRPGTLKIPYKQRVARALAARGSRGAVSFWREVARTGRQMPRTPAIRG
jgi:hypothetical protein